MVKQKNQRRVQFIAPKAAFTLAEVLITLAIIGIVAAMTIPQLLTNWEERSYKSASTAFEKKFGEALRLMHVQSNLQGFETTKEFVGELGKYIKIVKVCDKPEDCFTKKIKQEDKTYLQTSTLTTSESLGRSQFETNTVGIKFADGITAILAYNPSVEPNDKNEVVTFSSNEYGKSSRTVKVSTNAITMVYDVNGLTKPNMNGKDVLGINSNIGGGSSSECEQKGDFCITNLGTNYKGIPCIQGAEENSEWCGKRSNLSTDYWAGARKACSDIGMRLPTQQELLQIWSRGTADDSNPSGRFWSSSEISYSGAYSVDFSNGSYDNNPKDRRYGVLCVGN